MFHRIGSMGMHGSLKKSSSLFSQKSHNTPCCSASLKGVIFSSSSNSNPFDIRIVIPNMSKATDLEGSPTKETHTPDLEPTKTEATHTEELKSHTMKRIHTLGSVRHRHEHTGQIILIPTPSKDPNDPLNW
jgi:hypothetical protein